MKLGYALLHSAAVFDGSLFLADIHSDFLEIVDNSGYPVSNEDRFQVTMDSASGVKGL